MRAHRRRLERGLYRRMVEVSAAQLDVLEQLGYLDSNDRGERAAECEAIETFIIDSLIKP
jgi:hypothetical protein